MSDPDLAALAADIRENGLRQPITILDGQVLDGRNRLAACQIAGVEPRFEQFAGNEEEALAYVLSMNLARRHLTTAQKAVLALRLLPLEQQRAAARKAQAAKDRQNFAGAEGKATEVAGTRLGVSGETVRQAARLAESAPDVLDAVNEGLVGTMPEALRLAAVPDTRRPRVIERMRATGGGRVSDADTHVRRVDEQQRILRPTQPVVVSAPGVRLLYGVEVRDGLRSLDEQSVHSVVTSPPYWGLRNYDTPPVSWADGWQGHLGLEPTPRLYVDHLVEVFRDVRRVLRDDGTVWVVIGDCYFGSSTSARDHENLGQHMEAMGRWPADGSSPNHKGAAWSGARRNPDAYDHLKPKDLVGIPWRLALALVDDGWFLRAEVIWAKLNPLPDPVRDRPTRSHESVFLFTKAPDYFYDQDAVREPFADRRQGRDRSPRLRQRNRGGRSDGFTKPNGIDPSAHGGRNRRSVWTIPTEGEPSAHYAVFPSALVEPMVLASTPEKGCCAGCGTAWRRTGRAEEWAPACSCGSAEVVPATVLDPFSGSGTTGVVARRLGRSYVGIDLSEEYLALAKKRMGLDGPG